MSDGVKTVGNKRQYSDSDKAAALTQLDLNGGVVSKTARELNIPRKTLEEWQKGRVHADVAEIRQHKKGELVDRLEELAHALVDRALELAPKGEATVQQVVTSLGITVDKLQLLSGGATDRSEHRVHVQSVNYRDVIEALAPKDSNG